MTQKVNEKSQQQDLTPANGPQQTAAVPVFTGEPVPPLDGGLPLEGVSTSPTVHRLFGALAAAQFELQNPAKASENPHFKSRYADLAGVLDAGRPVLARHGLTVTQFPTSTQDGSGIVMHTIIGHASGEFMAGTMAWKVAQATPQGLGSVITYARRYAYQSIVGLAGDDDDGNAASAGGPPVATRSNPQCSQQHPQPQRQDGHPSDPQGPQPQRQNVGRLWNGEGDDDSAAPPDFLVNPRKNTFKHLMALLHETGFRERSDILGVLSHSIGRQITSSAQLAYGDARKSIGLLQKRIAEQKTAQAQQQRQNEPSEEPVAVDPSQAQAEQEDDGRDDYREYEEDADDGGGRSGQGLEDIPL